MSEESVNRDFPQRKRSLDERLGDVVPDSGGLSSSTKFYFWLYYALTRYLKNKSFSAFVPFRENFTGAENIRTGFANFFHFEIAEDNSLGLEAAKVQLVRVLSDVLTEAVRDSVHYLADEADNELDDVVFDLFGVLYDLSPENAFRWAISAVSTDSTFGFLKGPNGLPAPVYLRHQIRDDDTSGEMRSAYYFAMLDWCVEKRSLPGTTSAARAILQLALKSSKTDPTPDRQVAAFDRLLLGFDQGQDLMSRIDSLVQRRGADAIEREATEIRKNLQMQLPLAVRKFGDAKKHRWAMSYLLGDALGPEMEFDPLGMQINVNGELEKMIDAACREGGLVARTTKPNLEEFKKIALACMPVWGNRATALGT